jgi:hypothetical protein
MVIPESLQWLAPAPLWAEGAIGVEGPGVLQPWVAEFTTDQFITEFLEVVGGQTGSSPSDLNNTLPVTTTDGTPTAPYRLFQPLSQRYYLVTGSLVCRRVGIPDRAVKPSRGERTSFVLRRITPDAREWGWVPSVGGSSGGTTATGAAPTGSWTEVGPDLLADREERHPMHPAPVAAFADPTTQAGVLGMDTPGRRTVHYGYIPVSRRERLVPAIADPVAALNSLQGDVYGANAENPMLGDLDSRVIEPWKTLQGGRPLFPLPGTTPDTPAPNTDYSSLYVLLDLGDWLRTNLPEVYNAILGGPAPAAGTAAAKLLTQLANVNIGPPAHPATLRQTLHDLDPFLPLVTGADIAGPSTTYDLTVTGSPLSASWLQDSTTLNSLAFLSKAALKEVNVQPTIPPELMGLIKNDPVVPVPNQPVDTYVARLVFEHDPCRPVVSQPSHPFVFARPMDADAPARKIRIQLPDISNLRAFNKGVALEMPPSLRRVVDRVNPKMLKGDGLGDDPGVELGMICSFSLQIIFLLAFMVMFIFLIAFNIIFWWMAFIKICFPIPVPTSKPKHPAP